MPTPLDGIARLAKGINGDDNQLPIRFSRSLQTGKRPVQTAIVGSARRDLLNGSLSLRSAKESLTMLPDFKGVQLDCPDLFHA